MEGEVGGWLGGDEVDDTADEYEEEGEDLEDRHDQLRPCAGLGAPGVDSGDEEEAGDRDELDGDGWDGSNGCSRIGFEGGVPEDAAEVFGGAGRRDCQPRGTLARVTGTCMREMMACEPGLRAVTAEKE